MMFIAVDVTVAQTVESPQTARGSETLSPGSIDEWPALQVPTDVTMPAAAAPLEATNCRYGVGYLADIRPSLPWVSKVGAGWLVNWGPFPELDQPSAETVYTIRIKQLRDANGKRLPQYSVYLPLTDKDLGYFVRRSPGAVWLVGNEIDVDHPLQDNIAPDLYAHAYHEGYSFIKRIDPTARVGNGSIAMVTPGRLQYLDIVWNTYKASYGTNMPVDVWNVHLYSLPERTRATVPTHADGRIAVGTDPALAFMSSGMQAALCPDPDSPDLGSSDPAADTVCLAEYDSVRLLEYQVRRMRTWMKAKGQQNRPLIVTEFGVLPAYNVAADGSCSPKDEFGRCFTPERVTKYLAGALDFMEQAIDPSLGFADDDYRLVQRWAWFSLYTTYQTGDSSNLLTDNYAGLPAGAQAGFSLIGQAFRAASMSTSSSNLVAENVQAEACAGRVELPAAYRNGGTLSIVEPFTVSYYLDENMTQPLGEVQVEPRRTGPVMGCRWGSGAEVVTLSHVVNTPGKFDYWYQIESGGSIAETEVVDNVGRGAVAIRGPELTADFGVRLVNGMGPLTIEFTDQSAGCGAEWQWSFGDGGQSTERHPQHTYSRPGTYSVSLTVSNGSRSVATTRQVSVLSASLPLVVAPPATAQTVQSEPEETAAASLQP